ncbi:MAG: EVE domain-containing protein [Thermodesulfobacteriota bacterium]
MANHWLLKSDPAAYGWDDLAADGGTLWDGVRNHQARNNINQMRPGDLCLLYHSVQSTAVVGVARVTGSPVPDPTAADPRWLAVAIAPEYALARPVTLAAIKADPALKDMALVRQTRLSVMPVSPAQFRRALDLGGGRAPA